MGRSDADGDAVQLNAHVGHAFEARLGTSGASTYPVNVRVNTLIYRLVLPDNAAGSAPVWPRSGRIKVGVAGTIAPAFLNIRKR